MTEICQVAPDFFKLNKQGLALENWGFVNPWNKVQYHPVLKPRLGLQGEQADIDLNNHSVTATANHTTELRRF